MLHQIHWYYCFVVYLGQVYYHMRLSHGCKNLYVFVFPDMSSLCQPILSHLKSKFLYQSFTLSKLPSNCSKQIFICINRKFFIFIFLYRVSKFMKLIFFCKSQSQLCLLIACLDLFVHIFGSIGFTFTKSQFHQVEKLWFVLFLKFVLFCLGICIYR